MGRNEHPVPEPGSRENIVSLDERRKDAEALRLDRMLDNCEMAAIADLPLDDHGFEAAVTDIRASVDRSGHALTAEFIVALTRFIDAAGAELIAQRELLHDLERQVRS